MAIKMISAEEVAKHSSEKDCWLVIHGKVYDVTHFLDEHPGGYDIVVSASGRDASDDFDEIGHSNAAVDMLKQYMIGEMASSGGAAAAPAKTKPLSPSAAPTAPTTMLMRALLPILLAVLAIAYALRS